MFKIKSNLRSVLCLGAATLAAVSVSTAAAADEQSQIETVVVTGSMIQGNTHLVSPITVIDTNQLERSGISTIENALQKSNLNSGPSINNSWTANGNFAQGASAASLRGLSTNSTLVLFDGLRAAYYPLADDGVRNFVDLNTIPDDIVDRVEILRDGASSSYGADAIAGVVNIITKRSFEGLAARAEAGVADRGDAGSWKMSVTGGIGDLESDHVNAYISANYYHSDKLNAASRPYPFNSYDWSRVCYQGTCSANGIVNGIDADGSFGGVSTGGNFLVRPYELNATGTQIISTAVAGSRWQNETTDCGPGTEVALTPAQQGAASPATICQYDYRKLFGVINPAISRFGLNGHVAFELNGIEGWAEANFMQDSVSYPGNPAAFYANAPTGIFYPRFSTAVNYAGASPPAPGSFQLFLPIYVCAERVGCDTAADRVLNPNNPFAADGYAARLIGRDVTRREFDSTRDRSYRVAGGLNGTAFGDVDWNIAATAMHTDLRREARGYVYIQHLLDVIADGSYNFLNPSLNSKALNDYLYPTNISNASSDEAMVQATAQKPLFELPGGDLTLALGTSIAYEAVDGPSMNSDINGPTQRWFTLNAFGTKGKRDVYSAFFEISAPVLDYVKLNVSGRYDSYSTGQSNFTPKFGVWAKPFESLVIKGTYSEGFRIPSFAEAAALPTTGYVGNTVALFNDAYLAQYGCDTTTFATCPTYIKNGSYGLTTTANPHLSPEKSRSWVLDVTWQPFDSLQLTTTYYNIKKTRAIAQLNCGSAIKAYYAGTAIPPGCTIVADAPDPSFPTATPRVAFLEAPFVNANAVRTSGFDFGVTYDSDVQEIEDFFGAPDVLGPLHVSSTATASFIQNLDTKFPDGTVERYDGTLGNNNLTAGNGTSKWRGYWQTTFDRDIYEFTSTLNWYSGYNLSAMDQGTGYRDCGLSDGSVPCRINDYFTWDVNAQVHVGDNTTLYLTMNNVLDNMPPVDTIATYALTGYNDVVGADGILGRYLKVGIKFDY